MFMSENLVFISKYSASHSQRLILQEISRACHNNENVAHATRMKALSGEAFKLVRSFFKFNVDGALIVKHGVELIVTFG